MENKKEKKLSFFGKISLVLFLIFAGFISWAIYKQTNKRAEIQSEITKLEEEAQKITKENFLAQERITYFESSDYQEREAKDKLNLKDPQENVVIVKPGIVKKEAAKDLGEEETNSSQEENKTEAANYKKWWNYLVSNIYER